MIAHALEIRKLNAMGYNDVNIGSDLGISRQRVSRIRTKLRIPRIPLVRHCGACGVAYDRPESGRQTRCPQHRAGPRRSIEAPSPRMLSTEWRAVRQRQQVASRKAQGRCVAGTCAIQPRAGAVYCEPHLARMRTRNWALKQKRKALALCIRCGAPRMDDHVFCLLHLDMAAWRGRQKRMEGKKLRAWRKANSSIPALSAGADDFIGRNDDHAN